MLQQIVVIHGGDTFQSYNEYLANLKTKPVDLARLKGQDWKSTLGGQLGVGFEVLAPRMPNAQNAKYLEWKVWFAKIAPLLNDGAVLAGHSLGGLFLAKYLSEERFPKSIRAVFLIAAPFGAPLQHDLTDFVFENSLEKFSRQAGEIYLYHSQGDEVVPISHLAQYQTALPQAHVRILQNRQHFNQEQFPELIADLKKVIKKH